METAQHEIWRQDEIVLAGLGRALFQQPLRISVRLPAELARQAVSAWERDDEGASPSSETDSQIRTRKRAAALALVGLTVEETGIWVGDEVEVQLDAWYIGASLDAADDHGLLVGLTPPETT